MSARTVAIDADRMSLPNALYEDLGSPSTVVLLPVDGQSLWLRRRDPRSRVRRTAHFLLGRGYDVCTAVLKDRTTESATYQLSRVVPTGEFGVANYGEAHFLIPLDSKDEVASREQSWAEIQEYHEHLPIEQQDANAWAVSRWLAGVLAPLGNSFLEIGCGAGRNLRALADVAPSANIAGIDVNESALSLARREVPSATLSASSLYALDDWGGASVDVVFTSGVLVHVPHTEVAGVVREMHRIASNAVVHFELHGPDHPYDYHRYPRDYGALHELLDLDTETTYEVFPRDDFRSMGTGSFWLALLVAVKSQRQF
ncbi:MAG: methyltransferase domain-containing protein [Actinobacteria bacterium]|nr:methyltransferase domain-containing protein [Actinomycetota bacterium]